MTRRMVKGDMLLICFANEFFVFISEIPVAPQLWCNCLTAVV